MAEKKKRSRRRIDTAQDVKRQATYLFNEVLVGNIESKKAGRLGYLLTIILRAIEGSEIEARLKSIEDLLQDRSIK